MYNKVLLLTLGIICIGAIVIFFSLQTKRPTATLPPSSQQTNQLTETPQQTIITITSRGFQPETVKVKAGTIILWKNESGTSATINSNDHPTHLVYPPLNLGTLQNGKTRQFQFAATGTYGYHNHFKPQQKGTVIVE